MTQFDILQQIVEDSIHDHIDDFICDSDLRIPRAIDDIFDDEDLSFEIINDIHQRLFKQLLIEITRKTK